MVNCINHVGCSGAQMLGFFFFLGGGGGGGAGGRLWQETAITLRNQPHNLKKELATLSFKNSTLSRVSQEMGAIVSFFEMVPNSRTTGSFSMIGS